MAKWVLTVLGVAGLVALSVKEFPALMREIKIWRMGSAPQGPIWYQRAGGG
ncbi:MAG: hypothetical protein JO115_17680 [Pseudonocardiales bacterium]|nr:hypothetical protein [Pseudonocardiales bacterium]